MRKRKKVSIGRHRFNKLCFIDDLVMITDDWVAKDFAKAEANIQ